jgi:hypothetical protein
MRLSLALCMLCVVGCSMRPDAVNEDARLVVAQFLAARAARNLEATMECFIDQPEMRSSLGVGWTGRDAVKAIMAYRLTDTYKVGDLHVSGDRVTWSEHVTRNAGAPATPGVGRSPAAVFDEDVEAVVTGGRIAILTTFVGGGSGAFDAPQFGVGSSADVLLPLSVLVLVATAVLVWPTAPAWRAPMRRDGHLMNGLREYVARRG